MAMQDSTALAFEQGFQRAHQMSLNALERENTAAGNIAEQTRLGFLEMKTGADIAESILNQRSVQNQPQINVQPKV